MGAVVARAAAPLEERLEEKARDLLATQQLLQIRGKARERQMQLSARMATLRERVWWMLAFYGTMGVASGVRMARLRRLEPLPLAVVPFVLVPYLLLYQADFAYGSKSERIHRMAEKIRQEQHWFNEPVLLPSPSLRAKYLETHRQLNDERAAAGLEPLPHWAQ